MDLFSNIKVKETYIKNRIVLPPMVCFGYSDDQGFVSDKNVEHYKARAIGGVGTIIVEATCVHKNGRLSNDQLGIWSDAHIDGLKRIADECHKYNTSVLLQIHHAGLKTPLSVTDDILAPSKTIDKNREIREMTLDDIYEIKSCFVNAAIRAEIAGFDGIEIHGAHGYLISQFMSPLINRRNDKYGGSIINRTQFAKEIIGEIKEKVDKNFIIGYRMGGNEPSLQNGLEIAKLLESYGVDLLHISAGISDETIPIVEPGFNYNWIVYCGTEINKVVTIPVIVVNGIRTTEQAQYILSNKLADFVAIGKAMLIDSNWAKKSKEKQSIIQCEACKYCYRFSDIEKCPCFNK